MKHLFVGFPLPGVGGRTLAKALNALPGVQALCHSSLYLYELSQEFECAIEYLEEHMHLPSDKLALFHAGMLTRQRNRGSDFYEPRAVNFYLAQYVGEYASHAVRAAALLMAVGEEENTVVILDRADGLPNLNLYQQYAERYEREFRMLDIVRSGAPGLGARRFKEKEACPIDVVEGRPAETARAIAALASA